MGRRIFHIGSSIMHTRNESIVYESKQQCEAIKQLCDGCKRNSKLSFTKDRIRLDLEVKSSHLSLPWTTCHIHQSSITGPAGSELLTSIDLPASYELWWYWTLINGAKLIEWHWFPASHHSHYKWFTDLFACRVDPLGMLQLPFFELFSPLSYLDENTNLGN